jgi:hypothetical protein
MHSGPNSEQASDGRRQRPRWFGTDRVRGGTGPLSNLVVLVASFLIVTVIGAGLYYVYFVDWPSTTAGPVSPQSE